VAHDTSYTFDLDRMLAPFGNTAPYLQYAGARIRSIGRKAEAEGIRAEELATATISLDEPTERELALSILGFADVIAEAAAGTQLRNSRLRLSAIVLEVLETGLGVLGIRVPERM